MANETEGALSRNRIRPSEKSMKSTRESGLCISSRFPTDALQEQYSNVDKYTRLSEKMQFYSKCLKDGHIL